MWQVLRWPVSDRKANGPGIGPLPRPQDGLKAGQQARDTRKGSQGLLNKAQWLFQTRARTDPR